MKEGRHLNKVRWFRVYNSTHEIIPGYACMKYGISGQATEDVYPYELNANRQAVSVMKPDDDSEAHQDWMLHCINSPFPILPERYGNATIDFPALALHEPADRSRTFMGDVTGIQSGKWELSRDFAAYRSLHRAPVQSGALTGSDPALVWVIGNTRNQIPHWHSVPDRDITIADLDANTAYGGLQFIDAHPSTDGDLTGDYFGGVGIFGSENTGRQTGFEKVDDYSIRALAGGRYMVHFDALFDSPAHEIQVRLKINGGTGGSNNYPHYSATGPGTGIFSMSWTYPLFYVNAGDVFSLGWHVDTSVGFPLTLTAIWPHFWIESLARWSGEY